MLEDVKVFVNGELVPIINTNVERDVFKSVVAALARELAAVVREKCHVQAVVHFV